MHVSTCMAAVAVSDLARAAGFYASLFGREADLTPMPTLHQWNLPDGSALQVVKDAGRAGTSMATLVVPDLDATLEECRRLGLDVGDITDGVLSRLTELTDVDGNLLTVVEPPREEGRP